MADEVADEEVFRPPAEVRQQRRALAGCAAEHNGPFFAFFAHGAEDSAHVALHIFRHSHAVAPLRRIAHAVDGAQLFVEIYAADRAAAREYHVRYRRKSAARGRAHEHLLRFMYRGEAARLALRFQLFGMLQRAYAPAEAAVHAFARVDVGIEETFLVGPHRNRAARAGRLARPAAAAVPFIFVQLFHDFIFLSRGAPRARNLQIYDTRTADRPPCRAIQPLCPRRRR